MPTRQMVYILGTNDAYMTFKIILKNFSKKKKMPHQLKNWKKKKQKEQSTLSLRLFLSSKNQSSGQKYFFIPNWNFIQFKDVSTLIRKTKKVHIVEHAIPQVVLYPSKFAYWCSLGPLYQFMSYLVILSPGVLETGKLESLE